MFDLLKIYQVMSSKFEEKFEFFLPSGSIEDYDGKTGFKKWLAKGWLPICSDYELRRALRCPDDEICPLIFEEIVCGNASPMCYGRVSLENSGVLQLTRSIKLNMTGQFTMEDGMLVFDVPRFGTAMVKRAIS